VAPSTADALEWFEIIKKWCIQVDRKVYFDAKNLIGQGSFGTVRKMLIL
jgi:hypothetical protein